MSKPWLDVISKADLLPPQLWPDHGPPEALSHGTDVTSTVARDQQPGPSCDSVQGAEKSQPVDSISPAGIQTGAFASEVCSSNRVAVLPEACSAMPEARSYAAEPAEKSLCASALPPTSPSSTELHTSGRVEVVGSALRQQDPETRLQVAESTWQGIATVSWEPAEQRAGGAQRDCGSTHGDPERLPEGESSTRETDDVAALPRPLITGRVSNDECGVTGYGAISTATEQVGGPSEFRSPSGHLLLAEARESGAQSQCEVAESYPWGQDDEGESISSLGDRVAGGAPDVDNPWQAGLAQTSDLAGDPCGRREQDECDGLPTVPRGPADLLRLLPEAVLVSSKTERGVTDLKRQVLLMFAAGVGQC